MSRDEDISRMLDGELSAEDEAVLRQAIRDDPELAALAQTMAALPEAIADLPIDRPVPDGLNGSILAPKVRHANRWPWVAVAAVAATMAVALGPLAFRAPAAEVELVHGVQHVRGVSIVQAGAYRVAVNGHAKIIVEPVGPVERKPGQEEPMKPVTHILSAAGGAALTVAVLQGSALIYPPDDAAAVPVHAGQVHRVGAPATAQPIARSAPEQVQHAAPEVTDYITSLEQQLDQSQFQAAMLQGQLAARDGTPVEWPSDLPVGLGPDDFHGTMKGVDAEVQDLTLQQVDCSEYPCMAVFAGDVPADNARDLVDAAQESLKRQPSMVDAGALSSSIAISETHDAEDPESTKLILVLAPTTEAGKDAPNDLALRLNNRMQDLLGEQDPR